MACVPSEDSDQLGHPPSLIQISLGVRPVWSESSLSAWRKLGSLAAHWAQAKTLIWLGGCPGWSESSLCAKSFCWFCHEAAQFMTAKRFKQGFWYHKYYKTFSEFYRQHNESIVKYNVSLSTLLPKQIATPVWRWLKDVLQLSRFCAYDGSGWNFCGSWPDICQFIWARI